MVWEFKKNVNGTKIYQWDINYATRNDFGSGPMNLNGREVVMHNLASSSGGNSVAKAYAENI